MIGLSAIVSGFFLVVFIGLFIYVRFSQTHYISALTNDISKTTDDLKAKEDLDKILTVQNQLNSLPGLHDKKVISSRLLDYLGQVTPTKATISNVDLDLQQNTLAIKGNADTLGTVNKFADTLKFTDFQTGGDNPASGKAFNNVVLKSFSVNSTGSHSAQGDINYELQLSFDPMIFANIKNLDSETSQNEAVKLKIPNIITTRSETQKPGSLFAPQPDQGASQ
jgi:hypothetical protein